MQEKKWFMANSTGREAVAGSEANEKNQEEQEEAGKGEMRKEEQRRVELHVIPLKNQLIMLMMLLLLVTCNL